MDSGAQKLLESATHRTLHAHNFSRTSSQASLVLTDLLARYLNLLSLTCAKYAQHAGRTRLTAIDAVNALDELGVGVEELSEYCALEGYELGRYALKSARRVEDLNEFRAQLSTGLRQDVDDAIPLEYRPFTPLPDDEGDEDQSEFEEEDLEEMHPLPEHLDLDALDTNEDSASAPKRVYSRPSTPPLPLSPISNPSSPIRKRRRSLDWNPPAHIPDFLPPFPTTASAAGSTSPIATQSPGFPHLPPPPIPVENVKIEKPPSPIPQPLTTSAASDYQVQVPYSQSSLALVPEWHLPSAPPSVSARAPRFPTPQTEPALLSAYHHILTHPPPPTANTANPARHKVAMALLSLTQGASRWDPPDTLYSNVAPNLPRAAAIGPTFPVPLGTSPSLDAKKPEKDFKFPAMPRPVAVNEFLTSPVSQQSSRVPELARHVLPSTIYNRTSRLGHPPVLFRGAKQLTYGNGIPAPWNANTPLATDGVPPTPMSGKPKELNGLVKEPAVKTVLPDARLYATWDYEPKDFRVPLVSAPRNRGRIGSVQGGSGVISLAGLSGKGRNASKASIRSDWD